MFLLLLGMRIRAVDPTHQRPCPPPLALSLQARWYSASLAVHANDATVTEDDDTQVHESGAPAASAPVNKGSKRRLLWVQRPGAQGLAAIEAAEDMYVGQLVKVIKTELGLVAPLDSIILQLASADGTPFTVKDAAGKVRPVTLDPMETIKKALKTAAKQAGHRTTRKEKLRIIADLAAPRPALDYGECTI